MRPPGFWKSDSIISRLLIPFGWGYGIAGVIRRRVQANFAPGCPVVCVGNIVAGGAGKTPVAIAICKWFRAQQATPHFLTRGYGGSLSGPVQVVPERHDAGDVGDEALLLAAHAPTWVSRDRAAGAAAAVAAGADVIVMDDGHQNGAVRKTLSMVIVDGAYGFGNGRVIPAGPLREPLDWGFSRADIAVVLGSSIASVEAAIPTGFPVIRGDLVPDAGCRALSGRRVVAFAGIGRPEKFFETVAALGCAIASARSFPDHHSFTAGELAELRAQAASFDAQLLTTEKDLVRIGPEDRSGIVVIPVEVEWEETTQLDRFLSEVISSG